MELGILSLSDLQHDPVTGQRASVAARDQGTFCAAQRVSPVRSAQPLPGRSLGAPAPVCA
jgi:hypothetical protein